MTKIPRRTLLFASLALMTLANLSAGLVSSICLCLCLCPCCHCLALSSIHIPPYQVLLRQQPETALFNNSSVTDLATSETTPGFVQGAAPNLEEHKIMKVEHGIVEADLGPGDPGPVLLPEPSNTEHMIRWEQSLQSLKSDCSNLQPGTCDLLYPYHFWLCLWAWTCAFHPFWGAFPKQVKTVKQLFPYR